MKYQKDLTGLLFNRLTVLKQVNKPKHLKKVESYWLCKCECGNELILGRNRLITNHTTSCGCLRKENARNINISHQMSNSKFYKTWSNMIQRCTNDKLENYKHYGYRGIKVCGEWLSFENFMNDMYQSYLIHADVNGEEYTTLDRKSVDGDYNINNCKWSTIKEQANNKRTNIFVIVNNKEFSSLAELSEAYDINAETLRCRYHAGKRGDELIYKGDNKH